MHGQPCRRAGNSCAFETSLHVDGMFRHRVPMRGELAIFDRLDGLATGTGTRVSDDLSEIWCTPQCSDAGCVFGACPVFMRKQ